jgi:aryl-phospho-beta-D-glucosidase BglC (GH1 family)
VVCKTYINGVEKFLIVMIFSAKYLNGRGVGSRYDGSYPGSTKVGNCTGLTGNASSFSSSYKTFLRQYWEAQASTFEKGSGWIQWVRASFGRLEI